MWDWEAAPSAICLTDDMDAFSENPTCDKRIVEKTAAILDSADIVVIHNGKKFDWPHFKGRMIYHRIPPIKKPYIIDTLQEAKTSAFPANSLGALTDHLKIAAKLNNETVIKDLITGSIETRAKAVRTQTTYGLGDIIPMKELYYLIRPYMDRHPNLGAYIGKPCCPVCGSENILHRGTVLLQGGNSTRAQYSCGNKLCGKRFKGKIVSKAKMTQ
jgi:hypothetical protein